VVAPDQALVPDTDGFGKFGPPALSPLVEGKTLDPLAEWQIFAQTHHVKSHGSGEFKHSSWRAVPERHAPVNRLILPDRAGCQTCHIAGFRTLKAMGRAADLGVGDTAGLATCVTGPLG
jgi:hypothetical protein